MSCPVEVHVHESTTLSGIALFGEMKCRQCGAPLESHTIKRDVHVPPGMAYAMVPTVTYPLPGPELDGDGPAANGLN